MRPFQPKYQHAEKYFKLIDGERIYSNFGPIAQKATQKLAQLFSVTEENIALCNNATSAIEGAILTCQNSIASVAIPNWTFSASGLAAVRTGLPVILVDTNAEGVLEIGSTDSDCEVFVTLFGDSIPSDIKITESKTLLIDAAASFDALTKNSLPLKENVAVILSFHSTKILGCGEGGMIMSSNKNWITEFKQWQNFGFKDQRSSYLLGTNAKMSEYTAALLLSALDQWEVTKEVWASKQNLVNDFCQKSGVERLSSKYLTPYWIVKLRDKKSKNILIDELRRNSIDHRDWWGLLHRMPAFSSIARESYKNSEQLFETSIGLPFFYDISHRDLLKIFSVIKKNIDLFRTI